MPVATSRPFTDCKQRRQSGWWGRKRRNHKIAPLPKHSTDYKRQVQRELQSKYWKLWAVQVRCYRRAGQPEKAAALLVDMERRRASPRSHSGPVYWDALVTLARLYEEGNQKELATQNLDLMQEFPSRNPDPSRSAQLDDLRKQVESANR